MSKRILGFKPKSLQAASLLIVVHEDGSYDYITNRTLGDVQRALEVITRDVKTEIEERGDF